ncbi:DUF4159 domain-containing protein [Candidatus Latescibacterota bacterium]
MKIAVLILALLIISETTISSETVKSFGRSVLVVDPDNRHNIRGEVRLAVLYGDTLKTPPIFQRYLINLKEAFHRWTKVRVELESPCRLDSPRLLEMPFACLSSYEIFELSPPERANIKNYFKSGGFMLLDNARPTQGVSEQEAAMKKLLYDALGPNIRFKPISRSHPIFYAYFELPEGVPLGVPIGPSSNFQSYVKGVWSGDRMVAILSNRGYTAIWNRENDNQPQLRFGINTILYALIYGTRENK